MDRYLTDRAQNLLNSGKAIRIAEIESDAFVEHAAYTRITRRLEKLLDRSPRQGIGGMMLWGDTGLGKSSLLQNFAADNPSYVDDEGDPHKPVVYIPLNAGVTIKRVMLRILDELKNPLSLSASMSAIEVTLYRSLRYYKTRMIIIDEIQHFTDTAPPKQKSEFRNLLKDLGNMLNIPVIVCGLESALMSIETDLQLLRRLHPFEQMKKWTYSNEFRNLLANIEAAFPLQKASNLSDPKIARHILNRSSGILDFIVKILVEAGAVAVENGEERITLDLLHDLDWRPPQNLQFNSEEVISSRA